MPTLRGWIRRRAARRERSPAPASGLHVVADGVEHFRGDLFVTGWAYHCEQPITAVGHLAGGEEVRPLDGWGLPSPDLARSIRPDLTANRFAVRIDDVPDPLGVRLALRLGSGQWVAAGDLAGRALDDDPYHRLVNGYLAELLGRPGARVLEIGARDRSHTVARREFRARGNYVGVDIRPGSNVDVVGDAHALSAIFPEDRFDAVISQSTFEHLAMPWKVVVEINRVLHPDGEVLVATHQTWPVHEAPWDFWRFSEHTWAALFNRATGFEVLEAVMGEPCSIVARTLHPAVVGLDRQPAFLASAVKCRKIGEPAVDWEVGDVGDLLGNAYPE